MSNWIKLSLCYLLRSYHSLLESQTLHPTKLTDPLASVKEKRKLNYFRMKLDFESYNPFLIIILICSRPPKKNVVKFMPWKCPLFD